jgi:PTH1 family peptidyl-tRNA hydrolase
VIEAGCKLIVGLGNPGHRYRGTRHNAGFQAVEKLARKKRFVFKTHRSLKSLIAQGKIQGCPVCLALPQTFMNLSGEALRLLVKKTNAGIEDILIVYDEIALPLGSLKIKAQGSAGGHRGLASVIESLGTRDIARMRLGIAADGERGDLSDYVLSRFGRSEGPVWERVLATAAEAMEVWITEGIDPCMNRFNQAKTLS